MVEAGGPATQTGIWYQNSITALYLGDLLDLKKRPARERVIEVRVEAPSDVDDIIALYADGRRHWIQAKIDLAARGASWSGLWGAFKRQYLGSSFKPEDTLVLILGEHTALAASIRECCERAISAENRQEWESRLTNHQRDIAAAIKEAVDQ